MSQRRSAGHGDGETSGETLATVTGGRRNAGHGDGGRRSAGYGDGDGKR